MERKKFINLTSDIIPATNLICEYSDNKYIDTENEYLFNLLPHVFEDNFSVIETIMLVIMLLLTL